MLAVLNAKSPIWLGGNRARNSKVRKWSVDFCKLPYHRGEFMVSTVASRPYRLSLQVAANVHMNMLAPRKHATMAAGSISARLKLGEPPREWFPNLERQASGSIPVVGKFLFAFFPLLYIYIYISQSKSS
jgi:hypothetical protein